MKKISLVLCAAVFGAVCSWATELSFQVVQHNEALDTVSEETLVIEDQILDYFFNVGDIVTNEPALAAVSEDAEGLRKTAYEIAASGGAEYFIQLRLFYGGKGSKDSANISLKNLVHVQWTITDTASGEKIADVKTKVRKPASGRTDAEGVKEYAASVADAMRKELRKEIDKKSKR